LGEKAEERRLRSNSITPPLGPNAGNDVCAVFTIGVRPPSGYGFAGLSRRTSISRLWRADIEPTRTLYAVDTKGACDFPNSENATLAANLYFRRLNHCFRQRTKKCRTEKITFFCPAFFCPALLIRCYRTKAGLPAWNFRNSESDTLLE
jgi:hypothetical protein